MKHPADLQRLRDIANQQATLVYRLTELKAEENAILAKYANEPLPPRQKTGRPAGDPWRNNSRVNSSNSR